MYPTIAFGWHIGNAIAADGPERAQRSADPMFAQSFCGVDRVARQHGNTRLMVSLGSRPTQYKSVVSYRVLKVGSSPWWKPNCPSSNPPSCRSTHPWS
jgi:hypothetical protein